jgi:hypothetical protein
MSVKKMPALPWIWAFRVLVIDVRNRSWWVHALIVPNPHVLSKKWTWWEKKNEKRSVVDGWDDFDDEKLFLKLRWRFWWIWCWERDDVWWCFCRKKRLLIDLMSKRWKIVVCSMCDEVKWSKSKKEENVRMCSLKWKNVEWRWELLFPMSKRVRKSENNSLFCFWQNMRKESASWWVACRKSRAVKLRESKPIDRWLKSAHDVRWSKDLMKIGERQTLMRCARSLRRCLDVDRRWWRLLMLIEDDDEDLWWKWNMVDRWRRSGRRRHSMPKMCERCLLTIRLDAQRQETCRDVVVRMVKRRCA